MIDTPFGYYDVNGKIFFSKIKAFIHASSFSTPSEVKYHFYDDVWESALSTYVHNPLIDLEELYKNRALQIRESYDYLILNFSGGADSTTILEAFIKNNIKLDEVYVRWSKRMIDSDLYTPNSFDLSAKNMVSEWDFSIKPKLDWLRSNHPEIKIVIDDWVEDLKQVSVDEDLLFKQNHNFGLVNFAFSEIVSQNGVYHENKGKRVANIFGIDKPTIFYNSQYDIFNMCFQDFVVMPAGNQHSHDKLNTTTRVNFYYCPEYPILTLARAHAVAKYVKDNPKYKPMIDGRIRRIATQQQRVDLSNDFSKIVDTVCYPNWNIKTFQVKKPDNSNKIYHPWFDYIYSSGEFDHVNNQLKRCLNSLSYGMSDTFKVMDEKTKELVGLKMLSTKMFKLNI